MQQARNKGVAANATAETGPWLVTLDAPIYAPIMQYAENECDPHLAVCWSTSIALMHSHDAMCREACIAPVAACVSPCNTCRKLSASISLCRPKRPFYGHKRKAFIVPNLMKANKLQKSPIWTPAGAQCPT